MDLDHLISKADCDYAVSEKDANRILVRDNDRRQSALPVGAAFSFCHCCYLLHAIYRMPLLLSRENYHIIIIITYVLRLCAIWTHSWDGRAPTGVQTVPTPGYDRLLSALVNDDGQSMC